MTPKQLIKKYETPLNAAHALGYTVQAVQVWIKKNRIPPRAQVLIEAMTGGDLKAVRK